MLHIICRWCVGEHEGPCPSNFNFNTLVCVEEHLVRNHLQLWMPNSILFLTWEYMQDCFHMQLSLSHRRTEQIYSGWSKSGMRKSGRKLHLNYIIFQGWQWCWWHRYVGNFMMVTDLRCWLQNHYVGDFFRYVGDFLNVLNRSPTSWIGHQHLKFVTNTFGLQHPSPTSM